MKTETMRLDELIREHKRLIRVLKSGKGITQETIRQEKELRGYISRLNKRPRLKTSREICGNLPKWQNRSL